MDWDSTSYTPGPVHCIRRLDTTKMYPADLDGEVSLWRSRRLDAVWPIVYFDGIVVHVRGDGENAEGGNARWDLFVWPDDLRAEGSLSFRSLPLALLLPFLPGVPFYEPERVSVSPAAIVAGIPRDTRCFSLFQK